VLPSFRQLSDREVLAHSLELSDAQELISWLPISSVGTLIAAIRRAPCFALERVEMRMSRQVPRAILPRAPKNRTRFKGTQGITPPHQAKIAVNLTSMRWRSISASLTMLCVFGILDTVF
jgi:hypothetical protein